MPNDFATWLQRLGLGGYAEAFAENAIDLDILPHLTDDDLAALGLPLGDRRRLQRALQRLTRGDAGEPAATPQAAGDDQGLEGERRQVTVMFADLAGFTRLSAERDAEEVHGLLDRFFETVDGIVVDHGGAVDKHMGDCVMAVFGAPVAHADDPRRAALAALAIQKSVPTLGRAAGYRLGIHIGIAAGEVVASPTGSSEHRPYTVTGEPVNLAARLADRAQAGETLISRAVWAALGDAVSGEPLGQVALKGLDAPVPVWRLTGAAEAGATTARRFVGRRSELAQIENALDTCRRDGRGLALVVRGDVGIGKTRLVEEAVRHAEALGYRVHKGLVLDFGTGRGQDAIRSLVRGLLGLSASAADDTRRRAADRAADEGRIAADSRVYLNDLLDLPQPPELEMLYDAMDKPVRDIGRRTTVCELVRRAGAAAPHLFVVEDVHWADADTLAHLAALAATVAECRALLVMTTRIEGDPIDRSWRAACPAAPLVTVELTPLRPEEAAELATGPGSLVSAVAAECVERSGGNPLFLDLLLRNAEEAVGERIPGSIRSIVLARMDRLAAPDRRALQAAAVLGQRATPDQIRAVLGDPDATFDELIDRLLMRPDGDALLFSHALIRDAVYASLLQARRRQLHARAAAWFEGRDAALFAQHLERAEDARAAAAYLAAAEDAAARLHHEPARRLVERGLEIATEREDRFRLTAFLGDLLLDLGHAAQSLSVFESARAEAADDAERCRANSGLAAAMRLADRLDEALICLDAAQAAAEGAGLDVERSRIHNLRGNIYFPRGDIARCIREHEAAFRIARAAGSAKAEARALGGLGDAAYAQGRMLTALDYFERCCDLAHGHGFARIEAANRPMAAICAIHMLDLDGALAKAMEAVDFAVRVGHLRAEIIARHAVCIAHFLRGELNAARAAVAAVQALTRRVGARRFEAENLMFLAEITLCAGDRPAALKLAEEAMTIARETGIGYVGPGILGVIALATDDAARRQAAHDEAESILAAGAISHNVIWFRSHAIEAMLRVADWDAAEAHAGALDAYSRAEPLAWTDFIIARGRALAAHGRDPEDARARDAIARLVGEAKRTKLRHWVDGLERALATFDAKSA